MEIWQSVLLAIGGNTVLLAVLAWVAKSLFGSVLSRDLEHHKSDLARDAQQAIEPTLAVGNGSDGASRYLQQHARSASRRHCKSLRLARRGMLGW